MDLISIARATGLPLRRLRYVLDHRVLPGAEKSSRGHRVTRSFTGFEAFGIACAAALLHAGVRRPLVQRCMRELVKPVDRRTARHGLLTTLYRPENDWMLELAEGEYLRVVGRSMRNPKWRPIRAHARPLTRDPLIVMRLDASAIRDALNKAPEV